MCRSTHRARTAWLTLTLALVLGADAAEPPFISPEFQMDTPLLGAAWSTQLSPAVAFNGTYYLVVWADYRGYEPGTAPDVYGARVTTNGLVLDPHGFIICQGTYGHDGLVVAASGPNFLVAWRDGRGGNYHIYAATITGGGTVRETNGVRVADASSSPTALAVAGNGTDFLLVWNTYSSLSSYDVYGARISGSGVSPGIVPFAVSSQPGWERSPAVASQGSDYLVVWQDNRNATVDGDDIYAARVSAAGAVLDVDGFPISTGGWGKSLPAVAALGSNYLIAWEDARNGGIDVYGARLAANGNLMDASAFPIANSGGIEHAPRVVATATNYMVLWSAGDDLYAHYGMYATRVMGEGPPDVGAPISLGFSYYSYYGFFGAAATPDECLLVWPGENTYDIIGARFTAMISPKSSNPLLISTGDNAEQAPAVAFNGSIYLVVWQDNRNAADSIYGVRVAANGEILDPNAILICTLPGSHHSPAVAALNGQFLVTWTDSRNGWADIYGARVRDDGLVLEPNGFPITGNTNVQRAVAVAANNSHYLVVWRDDRNCHLCQYEADDIYAARVTSAGTVVDPDGIPVSQAPGSQEAPAVASNGEEFLVVWRDDRQFARDIYGAVVRNGTVIVPDIAISTAPGQQRGPEVASDGQDFFVVWRSAPDLYDSSYDIYGARVTRLGTVLDPNGFAICAAPGLQAEPAVAFGGTNYFVAWHDFRNPAKRNDIYGTPVSRSGAVLEGSGLLINGDVLDEDILAAASAGGDDFLLVGEGLRNGAPRVVANVVAFGELPDPPPYPDYQQALNHWQAQFSLPMTNDLLATAAGGGRFVAGGSIGRIAVSTNAVDWITNTPTFGSTILDFIYRNGFFVGAGYFPGLVLRSVDGTDWQLQGAPTIYGIEYANGRYVAVGSSGTFFTSTNYTNWTSGLMGSTAAMDGVAYGNGLFVAVGGSGDVRVSTNGVNWTSGVSLTNRIGGLLRVTYAQGQFVAVGYLTPLPGSGGAVIITSPNGTNWTFRNCPTTNWLRGVTYADGLFVAVGNNGTILSSPTGEVWTLHNSGSFNDLHSVTYGNGVVVAVGSRGTILVSDPLRRSAPRIMRQPIAEGLVFVGDSVTLNTAAIGTSPRQFQWFKDNQPLAHATGDTLTLSNLQESDSGNYFVVVSNSFGSDVSQSTRVTAAFRVGIIQPPLSQSIVSGGRLNVSVLVTGTPPYSFEWRRGPAVLASNVFSAPLNFLTLSNVQLGGVYQVRVRNPAPFLGVAANFNITLLADTDADGLPDEWEAAYNFATNNAADAGADPDLDGFPNLAEYEAGTDPTDGTSYLKIDGIRLSQQASSVLLDFEAVSNRTYTLLSRPGLQSGSWTSFTDIVARPTNRGVTITNPISAPTRFYRLVTPRAP